MANKTNPFSIENLNKLKYPTPFIVIDNNKISDNYRSLTSNFKGFDIHYAVKCNPSEQILKTLKTVGSKFEIASAGELERLLKIGVKPKDIIYSNTVKPISHIQSTHEKGIISFAFDSGEELEKIAKYAPRSNVFLRLSVRNIGSLIDLSSKFGALPKEAVGLMTKAKKLGLIPDTLAFHVGSQCEKLEMWDDAFEVVAGIKSDLEKKGIHITTLNIGGGFPIKYMNSKILTISDIARTIRTNIQKYNLNNLKFKCEPGRYLVGEAGVIGSTIIGKINRHNRNWLYLDVGRFQAFVEMFESEGLRYPLLTSSKSTKNSKFTLTGPSCDSYDTIMSNVSLPSNLGVGDRVYFFSSGSYTTVYGSSFNDFPVPKEYFVYR